MKVNIHIDGGARGNPGPAGVGICITEPRTDLPIHEGGYFLGVATNNVAEYSGLIKGLQLAAELGADELQIFSDSELMVKQILGEYRVKSDSLAPLFEQAQMLLLNFDLWRIKHVYREENKRADELVNLAIDQGKDIIATHMSAVEAEAFSKAAHAEQASAADEAEATAPPKQAIASPFWSAAILSEPGEGCPGPCTVGSVFEFGPTTPMGMCIHAAQAVFDEDPAHLALTNQRERTTQCEQCGARIHLRMWSVDSPKDDGR